MPSPSAHSTHVQVTTTADKPPTDSTLRAAMWWATRPWINTIAVLTLAGTFAGVLMLAVYLGKVDRLDLLQQAIASKNGLLLIVLLAAALAGTLLVAVFGSLWFFDIGATIYNDSTDVPRHLPWILLVGLVLWLGFLFCFYFSAWFNHWLYTGTGVLLLALVIPCCVCEIRHSKLSPGGRHGTWRAIGRGTQIGATFWFALMTSALAPLSLVVLAPSFAHEALGWKSALACVAISAPAPAVGWVSLWRFARGSAWAAIRKNIILAVSVAVCLGLMVFWPAVTMQTLKSVGVYSTSVEQFIIPSNALVSSLQAAGFATSTSSDAKAKLIVPATPASATRVEAFVRFRFGSVLVLCTTPADPMAPTAAKQNPANKHWLRGRCLNVDAGSVEQVWPPPESATGTK